MSVRYPVQHHLVKTGLYNKICGCTSHRLSKFFFYSRSKGLIFIHCCRVFFSLSFISCYFHLASVLPQLSHLLFSPLKKVFIFPVCSVVCGFSFHCFSFLLCMFFFLSLMFTPLMSNLFLLGYQPLPQLTVFTENE